MRNAIAPALFIFSSALGAQCIPFSSPTPGVITDPGDLVDHGPGTVMVIGETVDGTAVVAGVPGTYRSEVNLVFPSGRDVGHVNGWGRLTTPAGDLIYRVKGTVAGDPATREFDFSLIFLITGGTGLFEGASGRATFEGSGDAATLDGVTEGEVCLGG